MTERTRTRPLRRDAERNRRLILDVARELFAERGLGVTLDDVARRAGLGVGTVYRRFRSRDELVEALFEERVGAMVEIAEESLADPDPWRGLVSFLERTLALQAANRGLKELLLGTAEGHARVARVREQMAPLGRRLVARAQAAGALREDVAATDLPLLQIMVGAVVDVSRESRPDLWRRFLGLILAGMRADAGPAPPLPAPPLEPEELDGVMSSWRPPRR